MAGKPKATPSANGRLPLATPEEVSDYLKISVSTLANWRSKRYGPDYIPCGNHVRYDWEDVYAWQRAGKVSIDKPTAPAA